MCGRWGSRRSQLISHRHNKAAATHNAFHSENNRKLAEELYGHHSYGYLNKSRIVGGPGMWFRWNFWHGDSQMRISQVKRYALRTNGIRPHIGQPWPWVSILGRCIL